MTDLTYHFDRIRDEPYAEMHHSLMYWLEAIAKKAASGGFNSAINDIEVIDFILQNRLQSEMFSDEQSSKIKEFTKLVYIFRRNLIKEK